MYDRVSFRIFLKHGMAWQLWEGRTMLVFPAFYTRFVWEGTSFCISSYRNQIWGSGVLLPGKFWNLRYLKLLWWLSLRPHTQTYYVIIISGKSHTMPFTITIINSGDLYTACTPGTFCDWRFCMQGTCTYLFCRVHVCASCTYLWKTSRLYMHLFIVTCQWWM